MFTNNIRKIWQFRILFFIISFFASLCFLLVIGKISAQELPEPPIDENEVEDINVLAGAQFPGDANVLIYFDMSQSMGNHFGGAQIGNWDNTSTITTCERSQNVDTDYAKAHCIANAAGINTFLVNKGGALIHSAFGTTTITTSFFNPDSTIVRTTFDRSEGIFGGCGAIACGKSKYGNCSDTADFERFLDCIDFLYEDTVVSSVFSNAVEINCGPPTAAGTGVIATDKAHIKTFCTTPENRAGAANAIDNFASFLAATNAGNTDLMTCGAKHCISNQDVKFPKLVEDHSCNDNTLLDIPDTNKPNDTLVKDEYQLFKACMSGTEFTDSGSKSDKTTGTGIAESGGPYKQPTVEACTLNTTNAPFCSPGDNGSTRLMH